MKNARALSNVALAAILLLALCLRLFNLGFGLPSLYDPDEPLFVLKAVELLTGGTLNPRWFGHPGTTTIYLTALSTVMVAGWGWLVGSWNSLEGFTKAGFLDPTLVFLPARFMMVLISALCVWMTFKVGKRVKGTLVGLLAAAMLAVNSLHVTWSQVIRTDIGASLFMLGALYFAIRIIEDGRTRDYVLAGILTGLGVATKWPSATVFIAVAGASVARWRLGKSDVRAEMPKLAMAALAVPISLLLCSPYILLDWQTVVADLSGEARPIHLGHTGHGFWGNLAIYLTSQVAGSMGWPAFALLILGAAHTARASIAARWTLLPAAVAFLVTISGQNLIWPRWVLPAMPLMMIFAAVGIEATSNWLANRIKCPRATAVAVVSLAAIMPAAWITVGTVSERLTDTREMAASWATKHIPPGSSVALEHLELRLRGEPWEILFPLGEKGCIDGIRAILNGVRYDDVNRRRNGIPIVDLGNVGEHNLGSCRSDFAILTYYDLYLREASRFPRQVATYERLLAGGQTVAVFRPTPGRIGGPIVRIVKLQHSGRDR